MLLVIDAFENIRLLFTSTCSLVRNSVNIYDFTNFAITQKSAHILYTNNQKIKKHTNYYSKQRIDKNTHKSLQNTQKTKKIKQM